MKIKSMNLISYGKFSGKKIELSDGLNVICGGNEAGKSTVMAFIKAMLYGFTTTRNGDISANERKKFMPWNGTALQGELDLCLDSGVKIRLARQSGRSQSFDTLKSFVLSNGEAFEYNSEKTLGVGEDAFSKTLYIKQLSSAVSGENGEIEKKLINLTYSANEDVSYHEASVALKQEMKKYKAAHGNGGLINELQEKITDLNTELVTAERKRTGNFEIAEKLKNLSAEIIKYKEMISELEKMKNSERIRSDFDKSEKIRESEQLFVTKISEIKKEIEQTSKYLEELSAYSKPAADSVFSTKKDTQQLWFSLQRCKKKKRFVTCFGCAFIVLALLLKLALNSDFSLLIAAVFCIADISTIFLLERKLGKNCKVLLKDYNNAIAFNENIKAELKKYGVSDIKEYTEGMARYNEQLSRYEAAQENYKSYSKSLNNIREQLASYDNTTDMPPDCEYSTEEIAEEEQKIREMLEACVSEHARVGAQLREREKERRTPDLILAERAEIIEKFDESCAHYDALFLASECLDETYSQLSSDYTPALNSRAAQLLSKLTDGKYDELYIDKKYSVMLQSDGIKNLGYFSAGTIDAVYFCVRLAVADTLFGLQKPLFIDDGFVQYDEKREENVIKMLSERAKSGQQIILFTCGNAEKFSNIGAKIISL